MDLNAFPVDIFLQIAALLDRGSLLNLRLVSQGVHSAITPVALRNIRVFIGEHRDDYKVAINRRLETCASPLPNLYEHAKHLRVSLNAFYVSRYTTKGLLPDLWRTIAKLRSITSLSLDWDGGYDETEETLEEMPILISKAVESLLEATGGKLERLVVAPSIGENWFPQGLASFRGLKFLKVARDPWSYRCLRYEDFPSPSSSPTQAAAEPTLSCYCVELPVADIFGPLIAANPGLEELEFVVGCHVRGYRPDFVLPATLTKLTSLIVGGLNFGQNGFPKQALIDPAPLRNLRHLDASTTYSSLKLDVLWRSMQQAHTMLEALVTRQVSLPLVQYLASFSGLRSLEIHRIQNRPECSSLDITSTFVKQVLPRHAETLENLLISIDYDEIPIEGWTFDIVHWPAALSQLNKLRALAIHPPADPEQSAYSPDEESLVSGYQTLINHAESLPSLEELTINWIHQTFGCGTGQMTWSRACCKTLAKVTPRLVGTTGRPQVLSLFNGPHTSRKICDELDGSERWIWGLQTK